MTYQQYIRWFWNRLLMTLTNSWPFGGFHMPVDTPAFLGLILRKNERTSRFIEREVELFTRRYPDEVARLNEDPCLIGLSVAMNGADLKATIENLEKDGAVRGEDFVATGTFEGILGEDPPWLRKENVEVEHPLLGKRRVTRYSLVT